MMLKVAKRFPKVKFQLKYIDSEDDYGRRSWITNDQALNKLATNLINDLEREVEK